MISVIIPTYLNSDDIPELLSECVASLRGYQELILQFDKEGEGFAKTVNKGVSRSHGDWVAIVNNDTKMIDGSLNDYCIENAIVRPTLEGVPAKFPFVVMSRSVWDLIGGLDEDFHIGFYEDKLFMDVARSEGISIKRSLFRVWHKGSATISKMNPDELMKVNKELYLLKRRELDRAKDDKK